MHLKTRLKIVSMEEYLTIKQACELSGKSDKTIRNNFTSKKDELNKVTSKDVIIKKGREYGILKSYLIEYYEIETGNLLVTELVTSSKKEPVTSKKSGFTSKNKKLLVTLRNQLKDKDAELVKKEKEVDWLRNEVTEKGEQIKEHLRQNDQSQRLIAQLQQTNSTLLLEDKKEASEKVKVKDKTSPWWMIISLILITSLVVGAYFLFNRI